MRPWRCLAALLLCAGAGACGAPGAGTATDGGSETLFETDGDSQGDGEPGPDMGTDLPMQCPDPQPCDACECTDGTWSCTCPELSPKAGFVEIEPVNYWLGRDDEAVALESSAAKIFYAFSPAQAQIENPPIFVMFNGGPAVSSGLLMATNTGPATITPPYAPEPGTAVENPASWTSVGHVLYLDARGAGFSHLMDEDPQVIGTRSAGYTSRNFNTFLDGADFVRALLRILDAEPQITAAPVVIVAESYGGTRAGTLLNLVLFHEQYTEAGERLYADPWLVEEIRDHLALAFPDSDLMGAPLAASQFGAQVLIQPLFAGNTQKLASGVAFEAPNSILDEIDALTPQTYSRCSEKEGPCNPYQNGLSFVQSTGRSIYDWQSPNSWLDALFDLIEGGLHETENLALLWGLDPAEVDGLSPASRSLAYRGISPNDGPFPGDLEQVLGTLPPHDRYYEVFDTDAFSEFRSSLSKQVRVDPDNRVHGELFLENLVWVDTFMTNARRDIIIFGPGYPGAIASYDEIVSGVDNGGETIEVEFAGDYGGLENVGLRTIRFPTYDASHSVTLDAPADLLDDVASWLE